MFLEDFGEELAVVGLGEDVFEDFFSELVLVGRHGDGGGVDLLG